jgi:serine/threonine-protein kinase
VGVAIGNLKYISPEQIKGVGEVDARSDVYSLGMVLYEMLCGRPAFDCESHFELMAAQVGQTPVPPENLNAAVPQELGAVILKAIAKEPSQRYQSAGDFDVALAKVSGLTDPAAAAETEADVAAPPVVQASQDREVEPASSSGVAPGSVEAERLPPAAAEAPAPVFPTATGGRSYLMQALVVGSLAGTFLGVLFAALWLIVK